jgi:hypothetical protein
MTSVLPIEGVKESLINSFKSIASMKEDFVSYMILAIVLVIIIIMLFYYISLTRLQNTQCNSMEKIYGTLNGKIKSINSNNPEFKYNLNDYYINTAFNCCSGGSLKNDFVNICNLKSILKQGVRCLDFAIFSVDDIPVVSTSTVNNSFYIKETYNSIDFKEVMKIIANYGFSGSTSPNPKDPIIIHLRVKSNNLNIYDKMGDIFKMYDNFFLGSDFSFENSNRNIGALPIIQFMNKIILVVDKTNNTFLQSSKFSEFVNLTSNSMFMRSYTYNEIKNSPDTNELTEYNKQNMTIVLPDEGSDPNNPSTVLCQAYGCQMTAMRFQLMDNILAINNSLFDNYGYSFILKPEDLRSKQVTIPIPEPQRPELSYATRNVTTDFYSFDF